MIYYLLISLLFITAPNAFARDITVDINGKGDFTSVQEAINSVRAFDPAGWVTIHIKKGVYKEKVEIPTYNTGIRLVGEDVDETVIVWYDHANINNMGTFRTYTLKIGGNDIILENLTIENAAEPLGQAVAVHVEGDRIIFNNCRLLGNQDTYYGGRANCRQFFYKCYIEGTTDYIFGPSTVWFEQCVLHSKRNSYITAASTPQNQQYGFIFNKCTLTVADGVDKMYLGRPWRAYAMTVFRNSLFPA
ncbi:MAG: pectinesterase family protein, partial [Ignavibacteria bacterium]|nr:pectinesterase family protein [Ignavibacteria bacterium]